MNQFTIDKDNCTGCGLCKKACPAMLLDIDANGTCFSKPVEKLNWYGCWKCQHCMAVCPQGAISVFGKDPANSLPAVPKNIANEMDALIAGRYSCRHYKQENVEPELLNHMLTVLQNAPTGGNKMQVEYTIIDDIKQMDLLREKVREGYAKLREQKIYPFSWDDESIGIMESREEQAMNGDMFFCSAPHLFIPHMPAKFKSAPVDCTITMTYMEMLCTAHGMGTIYLGFPMNIMRLMPELIGLLQIPEDHYVGNILGFGYPQFDYARSTQKEGQINIHRLTFD